MLDAFTSTDCSATLLPRRASHHADRPVLVSTTLTAGLIALAAAVVPLLWVTAWDDSFTAVKLAALWALLGAGLLVVLALLVLWGRIDLRIAGHPVVTGALACWLGWNLLAFARSVERTQSLVGEHYWYQGLLAVLLYAGYLVLTRTMVRTSRALWLVAGGAVAGGIGVATVAWLQTLGADPVFGVAPPQGRVFSTIGQANSLGSYLVVTIAIGAAFIAQPERLVRVAAVLGTALMVGALILTESRGGFVGLAVAAGAGTVAVVWAVEVPWRRILLGAAVVVGLLVIVVGAVGPVRTRAANAWARTVEGSSNRQDVSNRIHRALWHEGWRISLDHPWFGTGQETFPDVVPTYLNDLPAGTQADLRPYRLESPHNLFLTITTGAGFPALAGYLAVLAAALVVVARAVRRIDDRATRVLLAAVGAATLGHLATDMFMTADLTASWLTWVLLGATLGVAATASDRCRAASEAGSIRRSPWDLLPPDRCG